MRHMQSRGFSLIELMVVITIIGLLASVVGAGLPHILNKGYSTTAKAQMENIAEALNLYRLEHHKYPKDLQKLTKKNNNGTRFIKEIPKDPWGNEYFYKSTNASKCKLICFGADGEEGGEQENADIELSLEP